MSLSPSLPPGAPSLAEVLIQRAFTKPPKPFVDGDFIEALSHADDDHPSVAATAAASARAVTAAANAQGGRGAGPQVDDTHAPGAAHAPAAAPKPGTTVDVRA